MDGTKEETSSTWDKEICLIQARQHVTEPYLSWQNQAEADINQLKRGIKHAMQQNGSPKHLWDYCGEWVAVIRCGWKAAHDLDALDGLTPEERVQAQVVDILAYLSV
jgi:hypothetical protein